MKAFFTTILTACILLFMAIGGISRTFAQQPQQSFQLAQGQQQSVEFSDLVTYVAKIHNPSSEDLMIRVINRSTGEQVSGFGLAPHSKEKITIRKGCKLVVENEGDQTAKFKVKAGTVDPKYLEIPEGAVSFTLRNTTSKSIPLLIPSVMNPNLSPNSRSGVNLEYGQKILFKEKGKKHVLLIVDETIQSGEEILVAQLLKQRRKELGL
ncbi:hypothetical protein [Pontibacter sp. G13]|uniref:hypothetical protein n=1 Tax=Pontibacter sp. G13 TaxID=3074898 RepID=UPI002889CAD7|nr:hypothetical protein [Pontibacter sp. G13]WNJ18184.1 hypothetical protein RJD25_25315 [Pontibacter sp. G13]